VTFQRVCGIVGLQAVCLRSSVANAALATFRLGSTPSKPRLTSLAKGMISPIIKCCAGRAGCGQSRLSVLDGGSLE
jgi:hypothetical protein